MPTFLLFTFLAASGTLLWAVTRRPAGCTGCTAPNGLPAATAPATALVVLGDSLAVGLAPYLKTWALARGLSFTQDAAVGRFTRQQGLEAVTPGALVFVSLGTNDATGGRSAGDAMPGFAEALHARQPRAIIWLVPPATKALSGMSVVRATLGNLQGVLLVSTAAPMRSDGLHPSSYAVVMRDLEPVLDRVR
jgi:hypothetical protein